MWVLPLFKDIFILTCIGTLLVVGIVLVLKSGVLGVGQARRQRFWKNASGLILALASCLTLLLMAQQLAGVRIGSIW